MKTLTPMSLVSVLAITALPLSLRADGMTNCLAIYLIDGSKTISPPVLSDPDFASFDTTHYTFVVTAAAAKRLARSIWDLEKQHGQGWAYACDPLQGGVEQIMSAPEPFVLEAAGEPIYSGAFYTMVSSSSFAGPVILPDVEFIKTNLTGNVSFRIELGYPGISPRTVQADTGLNVNDPFGFSSAPDPQGDIRIKSAVQQLFAHEKK